jgi:hypothetical protein
LRAAHRNLLTAAASLIFCVLALEGLLRLMNYSGETYRRPDLDAGSRFVAGAHYRLTKEGGSEGYINSKGIRDYEYPYEKPPDTYRILVFGDSYTEALQVDLEDTFVKILEALLNEKPTGTSLRYEVLNMGVSGYGTANAYFLYTSEGVKYRPDLVILAFLTGNDFRNNLRELDRSPMRPYFISDEKGGLRADLSFREVLRERQSGWRGLLRKLKRKSYLLTLVAERAMLLSTPQRRNVILDKTNDLQLTHDWNIYLKERPPVWQEAVRVTELALLKFRDRVRSDGADFLLATLTNGPQLSDKLIPSLDRALGKGNYDLEKPDRELRRFLEEQGIDFIQLLPVFRARYEKTGTYYHGFASHGREGRDGHWNEKGHRLGAEVTHEFLLRYIKRKQAAGRVP